MSVRAGTLPPTRPASTPSASQTAPGPRASWSAPGLCGQVSSPCLCHSPCVCFEYSESLKTRTKYEINLVLQGLLLLLRRKLGYSPMLIPPRYPI